MSQPDSGEPGSRVDRFLVAVGGVGIVALALFVLLPLWAPLIFAVWTGVLLDSLAELSAGGAHDA
ncbi:MAG: hypothetical protein ABJB12_04170 [Pseudomonadota bacterium]